MDGSDDALSNRWITLANRQRKLVGYYDDDCFNGDSGQK